MLLAGNPLSENLKPQLKTRKAQPNTTQGQGALIRIGFPLKGSLKGSIVGFYSVGALIRIGFWGPVYYNY